MLDSLRKYATSWVAQLLLGLLVASFSVWGVADIFTGYRANDIATVGSASVTLADFQRTYSDTIDRLAAQTGHHYTPDEATRVGIPAEVVGQLVSQAALDDAATRMGLGVSDERLGEAIADNQQFRNSTGKFDRDYLRLIIRQQGFTEDLFVEKQRLALMRGQLAQAFGGNISAPEAYLRAVNEYRGEARDLSYIVLTAPPASDIAAPAESDLAAYYDAHKTQWQTKELRTASYFVLSPETLAKPDEVSDEEAKKRYDDNAARFSSPEKRKVEQIVFKDAAEGAVAAAAIAGGKTFDDVMSERNLKPTDVDLGLVSRDKIVDKAVGEAAFGLAPNTVSGVIAGTFGPTIVRVTTVEAATETPFDQVKADLKKEIAQEKAAAEVNDLHDAIEDARAGGSTLKEVAEKYDLKQATPAAMDSTGNDITGKAVADLPAGLLQAIFATDAGLENDPIQPASNTFVWYEVSDVQAPRERPLTEVRDEVVAAWKDDERAKRLDTQAEEVKKRLQNKESFDTVAASVGTSVQHLVKVLRATTPIAGLSTASVAAAFDGPKGQIAVADGDQPMTKVVLTVDDVVDPPYDPADASLVQTKQQLDGQFLTDLLGLYSGELQSQAKPKYNQVALQSVLSGATTTN